LDDVAEVPAILIENSYPIVFEYNKVVHPSGLSTVKSVDAI